LIARTSMRSCDIYPAVLRLWTFIVHVERVHMYPRDITYMHMYACIHIYVKVHVISELTVINRDKRCEGWETL